MLRQVGLTQIMLSRKTADGAKELVRWTFFGSALSCTDTCCDVNSTWQFWHSKGEVGALPRIPGSQNHRHRYKSNLWILEIQHIPCRKHPSVNISPAMFFFSSLIPPDGSNQPPSKWLQAWWGDLRSWALHQNHWLPGWIDKICHQPT